MVYWTKERCHRTALKYNKRTDFFKNDASAYQIAWRNKWIKEICSHMPIIGNRFKRCIYAAEFPDNYVYIGLTRNSESRFADHLNPKKNTTVYKHIISSNLNPVFKVLTEYIDAQEASIMENVIKEEYEALGWTTLNRVACGATQGGNLKWTKEECIREASKYKTRTEFHYNCSPAWYSAINHGWLNECCSHMNNNGRQQQPQNTWTSKESCSREALKYNNRTEFRLRSGGAYSAAYKNGWLSEICCHMPKRNTPKHYKKKSDESNSTSV